MSSARERLARLAWLLDSSIRIPGTRFRIGLDALIGLVPFAGDLAGVLLSSYIVARSAALGAPKSVLARMLLNIAVEGIVGIVPLAGDVFDAAFKANQRNVRLLDAWLDSPRRTARRSGALVAGLALAVGALVVAIAALGIAIVQWLLS